MGVKSSNRETGSFFPAFEIQRLQKQRVAHTVSIVQQMGWLEERSYTNLHGSLISVVRPIQWYKESYLYIIYTQQLKMITNYIYVKTPFILAFLNTQPKLLLYKYRL